MSSTTPYQRARDDQRLAGIVEGVICPDLIKRIMDVAPDVNNSLGAIRNLRITVLAMHVIDIEKEVTTFSAERMSRCFETKDGIMQRLPVPFHELSTICVQPPT